MTHITVVFKSQKPSNQLLGGGGREGKSSVVSKYLRVWGRKIIEVPRFGVNLDLKYVLFQEVQRLEIPTVY